MPIKPITDTIHAQGTEITVVSAPNKDDFISLTDIARHRNSEFPADVVKNWLRLRSTIEFLGLWESLNNPKFKLVEFDQFKTESALIKTSGVSALLTPLLLCYPAFFLLLPT